MKRCLDCGTKYEETLAGCPGCRSTSFMIDKAVAAMWKDMARPKRPIDAPPEDARLIGVILALVGAGLGYASIYLPLLQADAGSRTVSIKGAVIVPPSLVFGLAWALFPRRAAALLGHRKKLTLLGWIFMSVLFVAGIAIEIWLDNMLAARGYVRTNVR
jgi:hypothetical protein